LKALAYKGLHRLHGWKSANFPCTDLIFSVCFIGIAQALAYGAWLKVARWLGPRVGGELKRIGNRADKINGPE